LHLEFMVPQKPAPVLNNRGNSGVLLMGLYEVQIFDSHPSHKQQIYADGQCGAIYGADRNLNPVGTTPVPFR
jgi:hypothetical protein